MAFDEFLGERIRNHLNQKSIPFIEKKMMGGLCFMVDDKMLAGVVKDHLMARVGPDQYEEAMELKAARPMDFTGRPMKGYVFADPEGIDREDELEHWLQLCLNFNPQAKSSKKK